MLLLMAESSFFGKALIEGAQELLALTGQEGLTVSGQVEGVTGDIHVAIRNTLYAGIFVDATGPGYSPLVSRYRNETDASFSGQCGLYEAARKVVRAELKRLKVEGTVVVGPDEEPEPGSFLRSYVPRLRTFISNLQ